jgi:hypothetical protein
MRIAERRHGDNYQYSDISIHLPNAYNKHGTMIYYRREIDEDGALSRRYPSASSSLRLLPVAFYLPVRASRFHSLLLGAAHAVAATVPAPIVTESCVNRWELQRIRIATRAPFSNSRLVTRPYPEGSEMHAHVRE